MVLHVLKNKYDKNMNIFDYEYKQTDWCMDLQWRALRLSLFFTFWSKMFVPIIHQRQK
jgi:hypothetical protein